MKKIKKIKFYDFTNLNGASHGGVNVYFYDMYGKLMMIDMSNSLINKSMEVEGNNTKANWIESYFDVLVITKKHEFVEKY